MSPRVITRQLIDVGTHPSGKVCMAVLRKACFFGKKNAFSADICVYEVSHFKSISVMRYR